MNKYPAIKCRHYFSHISIEDVQLAMLQFRRNKKIYGKCSKISNTLKLQTLKIIAENNL